MAHTDSTTVDAAHTVLQADYANDLRNWVEELQQMTRDDGDDRDRSDILDEYIDGLARVIHTGEAISTLRYCDGNSHNAYTNAFGTDGVVGENGEINWSALAYMAIYVDLSDRLSDWLNGEDEDAI
jgi:hypothetical protein